ncbi:DegQ family serine endoprotease [Candidatus Hepatincola sp. Pdp]
MRFLILILFFNLTFLPSILKAANQDPLQQSIDSVVSVYALSQGSKAEIEEFLHSNSTEADKGSGIIVAKSGLVITNRHVIAYKKAIKMILHDGRIFTAKIVAEDASIDLALLQLEAPDNKPVSFTPITMGATSSLKIGDEVFAIGNPFGIGISVSSGIISALPTNNEFANIGNLIQTDAAINPGSSGGALIDSKGQLIGMNTGKFGDTFVGIGFAIPVNILELFINRSLKGEKVRNYWLGFSAVDVNYMLAKKSGMDIPKGIMVTQVYKDTPAAKAKLQVGDIVIALNNTPINSFAGLSYQLALIESPTPLSISILRNRVNLLIPITPEIPKENVAKQTTAITYGVFEGLTIANNSNAIAYEIGIDAEVNGLVVYDIRPKSVLDNFGVKKGDIIVSANGIKINNVADMLKFLKNNVNQNKYSIMIRRNNTDITINVSNKTKK